MADCRVSIYGVKVHPFTSYEEILKYLVTNKGILVAINPKKILLSTDESRKLINNNIGFCDGMGVVKILHKRGYKDVIRIPGCELWLKIISMTYRDDISYYFIGGKQDVIDATIKQLKKEYPEINVANFRNGYIKTEEEKQALIDDIVDKKPDFVFVAMGSPKQELLMGEMSKRHNSVYLGLGGSFDVYTGKVKRAPQWWIDHNLEWAYRVCKEPVRLKRLVRMGYAYILIKLGLRKFDE